MIRRLPPLKPLLLTILLVMSTLLAGCHDIGGTTTHYDAGERDGQEDDPAEKTPEQEVPGDGPAHREGDEVENETHAPQRLEFTLQLGEISGPVFTGDPTVLTVELHGDNATPENLGWAGIRWSTESTTGADATAGPQDHETGVPADVETLEVPGGFQVTDWRPGSATTYHLRAHVEADGFHYWSDPITVEVQDPVEQGDWEADENVRFRTNLTNPCEGDTYSQDPLEIAPGTVVDWTNAANCPHTATHDAEDPLWDTGEIEPNHSSTHSYRFNKPGTYDVRCDNHPEMTAQIIVG